MGCCPLPPRPPLGSRLRLALLLRVLLLPLLLLPLLLPPLPRRLRLLLLLLPPASLTAETDEKTELPTAPNLC